MVTTDYRPLVSRKPPEGLLDWAVKKDGVLGRAGFVYHKEWMDDRIVAAVAGRTEKYPVVCGICSDCGAETVLGYAKDGKPYGFVDYGYYETVYAGDDWECSNCGAWTKAIKRADVGRGGAVTDECFVTSASTLHGEYGKRPLVLTEWRVQRLVTRDGETRYRIEPIDAYVFEEKDACRLRGWSKSYSGNGGYFMAVSQEWTQAKDWHDEMGQEDEIFGLTQELMEESCLHNSKLDLFMKLNYGAKLPVGYLRLYQKYPQVENLVVQGCGHILSEIFEELVRNGIWEKNKRGLVDMPPELHLEETRPAQMLGLNKDEFRMMVKQRWDLYYWEVYAKAKAVGDKMKLPEDIVLLHQYGAEDVEKVIGLAPVGKTLRYLMRQIETTGLELLEEVDPEGVADEDLLGDMSATALADYWRMAETAGWDLTDPAVRWPKNLIHAHDGAMAASKVILSKEMKRLIRQRAKKLASYAYESGELMIFPAGSQKQLNEEGARLEHCVATYGADIASGKTAIFFIRHTWAPKESYFTLEYKNGEVAQNRGKRNCARTEEVKAFEKEWLAWIRKGRPRNQDGTPKGAKPTIHKKPKNKEVDAA